MTLTMEQAWTKYERMVYHRCHSFNRSTGVCVDDLIGEAKVAFAKVFHKYKDKVEEEFGRLLYISVNNSLSGYVGKEREAMELPEDWEEVSHQDIMGWQDLLARLSPEASRAAELVVQRQEDIRCRMDLHRALREEGFAFPTIFSCMREIKQMLKATK